jgi:hypothetical protein
VQREKSQTLSCKSGPFVLDAAIDWASYCNKSHRMLVGDATTTCNLNLIGGKSDMCPAQTGYGSAIDVRIRMQALQIGIEFCYKTQQLTRTPERGIDPVFGAEGMQQLKLHRGLAVQTALDTSKCWHSRWRILRSTGSLSCPVTSLDTVN